jgi:hypothetical protein
VLFVVGCDAAARGATAATKLVMVMSGGGVF